MKYLVKALREANEVVNSMLLNYEDGTIDVETFEYELSVWEAKLQLIQGLWPEEDNLPSGQGN